MLDTVTTAEALARCETVEALAAMFQDAIAPAGMTCSASGMVSGQRAVSHSQFHFTNWPADWLALYLERKFVHKDPIPRWAMVSGQAVSWSELMAQVPPTDPGHEVMVAVADWDFGEGFVTPVRTRSGDLGLVSVGGPKRAPFSPQERHYLQDISIAVLNAAEALMGPPGPSAVPLLSLREQECVALLRQGFTDPEIARVLGISAETIRFHLGNARRKVGARNRVHLAAWPGPAIEG